MRRIGLIASAVVVTLAAVLGVTVAVGKSPASVDAQNNSAQTRTVTLNVPDMFCGGCEAAVKMTANTVDGVKDVKTSSDNRTAVVMYEPSKTNPEAIANAITKNSGFKVEVPKAVKK